MSWKHALAILAGAAVGVGAVVLLHRFAAFGEPEVAETGGTVVYRTGAGTAVPP